MITKLTLVRTESTDVFVNQGVECALFDRAEEGELILYLWANCKTVVVGRNQDAYAEVNVDALETDGGRLARRLSGGGAVYHDEGNLNFTFIARSEDFSLDRNRQIILSALKSLGLDAQLTGRNDIEIDGCKVSGNAYYKKDGTELHHGTMLVALAPEKVAKYLTPPSRKFKAKGVKSVSSRVSCLSALDGSVTVGRFAEALVSAFKAEYPEAEFVEKSVYSLGGAAIAAGIGRFASDEWRYGKKDENYTVGATVNYHGDSVDVRVTLDASAVVEGCEAYSDSLDEGVAEKIRKEIVGKCLKCGEGERAPEGSVLRALQEEFYEL